MAMTPHTIADRFQMVAARHPDQPAMVDGERMLTYAQAAALASRVGQAVLAAGIRPGDRVILLFDRGTAGIVSFLGGLRAGALVAPLLPEHPEARLQRMAGTIDARLIITTRDHADLARRLIGTGDIVVIDTLPELSVPMPPWPARTGDEPAYLLYTSGSTGEPRGVLHCQRGAVQRADNAAATFGLGVADRTTMLSSVGVGQGIHAVVNTLLSGATLCLFDVRHEGTERLAAWLQRERITVFTSSATLFRSLVRHLGGRSLPELRLIRIGSERVVPQDIEAQRRHFPRAQMYVGLASTETGAFTLHHVSDADTFTDGQVPVGRPVHGYDVVAVNQAGIEVPRGERGELLVRGRLMAMGYWNDAERTAQRFVPAPDDSGDVLFRSGDMGVVRSDGIIEHHGRKDRTVKIRGFRVEPDEVEVALQLMPGLVRAVVSVRAVAGHSTRLIAYVQCATGLALTVDALRTHLAARLPDHMIPAEFVFLEQWPLTASGKVALAQLPDPSPGRPALATAYAAPRNETERVLVGIWQEVLGVEHIGIHDQFLALGGDSLQATQVVSRLRQALGVDLPLWEMFDTPTIAALADRIQTYGGR